MFSEEQLCYTNTTLEDIWGVHPQISVFPATKLLFKKLEPKQQQQQQQ